MEHLIVDTDPGIDDAAALFFALASPEVRIDLITTVFGNVSVEQATVNACRLLALASPRSIPIRSGASKPLRGAPKFAKHIHRTSSYSAEPSSWVGTSRKPPLPAATT